MGHKPVSMTPPKPPPPRFTPGEPFGGMPRFGWLIPLCVVLAALIMALFFK